MFYLCEPEVAGGFGDNTELDTSVHPPIVHKLHYCFEGWMGDDLIESFPCFLVSERLKALIESNKWSGVSFGFVETTKSELFYEVHGDQSLPDFFWLKVTGKPAIEDFGITKKANIVISENVYSVIDRECQLDHCEITNYQI